VYIFRSCLVLSSPGSIRATRPVIFNVNQPYVNLVVFAHDHGLPIQSTVVAVKVEVFDVNDNAPIFQLDKYAYANVNIILLKPNFSFSAETFLGQSGILETEYCWYFRSLPIYSTQ